MHKGGEERFIGGPNEQVVNVYNYNDFRTEEETRVAGRRLEPLAFEALREVVEEVSACLFEAVDAGVKTKNAICATFETAGLMNVYFFLRWKGGVDEGGCDVALGGVKAELGSEDHHEANSAPLDDWGPGFEEIDALTLAVAANNKTGFEFLGNATGEAFDFEDPFRRKDAHPGLTINNSPSFEVVLKCLYLKIHGIEPITLVGATHGLSVSWSIGVGGGRLAMADGSEGLECTGGRGWVSNRINTVITRWT